MKQLRLGTACKSKTLSLNGDGVKVCFRTLEGLVKGGSFEVDLWERDDASADDDYDGFNTETFVSYQVVLVQFIQVLVEMLATKNHI
ncbi:hypothetical protein OKW24_004722 [Peribacillus simplex]|uniref:hypothetical protein n=1 Tax=Peribacillus simplex TaxID=1478 RepID=UPI0024E23A96|nr:hypothetical protein [Peribacillus simplex]MDF9762949.1 hypothetical protein [Peribacillus simplex]